MTEVTPELLREWTLPEPDGDGDKHDRGTVVVVGGSASTPGAVLLAGLATLRVGAGRLQVLTVAETSAALGVGLPEAKVVGLPAGQSGSIPASAAGEIAEAVRRAAAVVLGPGLLGTEATRELLEQVLPACAGVPVVIDAVALTALGTRTQLLDDVRDGAVLTPNAGEAAALLGRDEVEEGLDTALAIADRHGAVVTIRGWTVAPDGRCWHDGAGDIGLATSGSGDVLAGAVGGLLARGASPAQAAVWGAHLHAAAGERLAATRGRVGYLARELLDELPSLLEAAGR